jgi:hypothetical protein
MRATNVHIPTALSAALHPRLRQTASYLLPICPRMSFSGYRTSLSLVVLQIYYSDIQQHGLMAVSNDFLRKYSTISDFVILDNISLNLSRCSRMKGTASNASIF